MDVVMTTRNVARRPKWSDIQPEKNLPLALPMAPIVQSTSETPQGPLTFRVYLGDSCAGELYQDDGKSYAY